jgi:hypothetical protein
MERASLSDLVIESPIACFYLRSDGYIGAIIHFDSYLEEVDEGESIRFFGPGEELTEHDREAALRANAKSWAKQVETK